MRSRRSLTTLLVPAPPRPHPVLLLGAGIVTGAAMVIGVAALAWRVVFAYDPAPILPSERARVHPGHRQALRPSPRAGVTRPPAASAPDEVAPGLAPRVR